ncbi:MAG: TfoX/Sxy family protein [Thermoleophilia bacterium]
MPRVGDATSALFDRLLPDEPGVDRRPMFGQRGGFVNRNLFLCTFGDALVLRLGPDDRAALLEVGGEPFAPGGRVMREYIALPGVVHRDEGEVRGWVDRAHAFAAAMPPKVPKPAKPRGKRPRGAA